MDLLDALRSALDRALEPRPEAIVALVAEKPEALPAGRELLDVVNDLARELKFMPSKGFTKSAEPILKQIRELRAESAAAAAQIDFCGANEHRQQRSAFATGQRFTPRPAALVRAELKANVKSLDTATAELTARLAELARPECDAFALSILAHSTRLDDAEGAAQAVFGTPAEPPLSARLLRQCARVVATLIPEPDEFLENRISPRFCVPWLPAGAWE